MNALFASLTVYLLDRIIAETTGSVRPAIVLAAFFGFSGTCGVSQLMRTRMYLALLC